MRNVIIMAVAALALAGCTKSAAGQFAEMCAYQQKHDPESYDGMKENCVSPDNLSDGQKMTVVNAYPLPCIGLVALLTLAKIVRRQ